MAHTDVIAHTNIDSALREPSMFKIIYLNDNTTSMEFVIESLINFFDYSVETAVKITQDIHEMGSAVVAVLPYEIAEQKGIEVTVSARNQNYPLQVKLEPETA
jgi:ATP-dependent Clp protease adaptor protein ClpS